MSAPVMAQASVQVQAERTQGQNTAKQSQAQEDKQLQKATRTALDPNLKEELTVTKALTAQLKNRLGLKDETASKIATSLSENEATKLSQDIDKKSCNEQLLNKIGGYLNGIGALEATSLIKNALNEGDNLIEKLEKTLKEQREEEKQRKREEENRRALERQTRLTESQEKEYNKLVKQIKEQAQKSGNEQHFAEIQKKWNGQTVESLEIMRELAKLSNAEHYAPTLRPRHQEIFSDILNTLARPEKINQGIYSTCVPSSMLADAIAEKNVLNILKITNNELEQARCGAFQNVGKDTYLDNALKQNMLGGIMTAALMSATHNGGFNEKGQTIHNGQVLEGVTDKKIVEMYESIYGGTPLVIDNEQFQKLLQKPDLFKELIDANNGVVVKLRWDEAGAHSNHMVRVTDLVQVNGEWVVKFKNSQDEELLKSNHKEKIEAMNIKQFSERVSLVFVTENDKSKPIIEKIKQLGVDFEDGDNIQDSINNRYAANESPRESSNNSSNANEETDSDNMPKEIEAPTVESIVIISKGYYTKEEMDVLEKAADGTGIGHASGDTK